MIKSYFTFGTAHNHTINGVVFDHSCVCEIEAETHLAARETAFEVFGRKWAFQYCCADEVRMEFFPRGIIALDVEWCCVNGN